MFRRRDDREFSDYFVARSASAQRTAFVILGDWQSAEDAVQSAFAKVYVKWPNLRPEVREAYVRRAVVNESLTLVRRRRRESPAEALPDTAVEDPGDATGVDLGSALARLPARQRAIVALRFLDDRSVAEVASALDIAEGTVKSQTARALATLRTQLPTELEERSQR